ncbi:hypothetical protein [Limosilactobacillus albertensis]|uniref:Lipoprotein n=1 Tax=Limosilactobacillus albertensis TaxID=2759752 RepID=A0A839GYF6_9LACO|nr:hypothetical protein [Limosilactobacillus albertensis]MBB1123203.1 hypothetical protein [Limosilactobacillus albertensis]MCD7122889.1 hypothetical protein [Limosilactobacillus albertensis]
MKKIILTSTILLATLALAGCGSSQSNNNSTKAENSSLKAENSSLKSKKVNEKQTKYSDQIYALMAYLKLQNQTADDLNRNKDNMNWKQDKNKFTIDFGAHTTVMTVTDKHVQITYDKVAKDSMGQKNGYKVYSKQELAKEFGKQKNTLDEILSNIKDDDNESSNNNSIGSNQNSQPSTQDSQQIENKANNTATSQSNSTTNSTNSNQEKPLMKDGNTYRPKYNANGQVDSWQVTGSDGITRTMGDPSPNWQEIENEYNNLNNK